MRLINADEVKRFYENEFPTLDNGLHWSRNDIIMNLSNIPTVEAIPIDWMENWKRGKTSIEQVVADKIMMDYKYRDWEKENETN